MTKWISITIAAIVALATVFLLKEFFGATKNVSEKEQRALFVKERLQYEFDMVKDPVTGKIPENIQEDELDLARTLPVKGISPGFRTTNLNNYVAAGPTNIGGRTRGIAYDKRFNGTSNRVVMGGSVTGGIMRSTDGGLNWTRVSPESDIHNVTCFAQDPRPGFEDTWYAGTGEFFGSGGGPNPNGAFYAGWGVFKSINNGATWFSLAGTRANNQYNFDSEFDLIHRIAINPANGDVFLAGQNSIIRSQNGGTTWSVVKGGIGGNTLTGYTDVVINSTGTKIIVAFHLKNSTDRGVWQSGTGNSGSWTLLGGNTDDSPVGWKVNNTTGSWGRIIMELAPSNENILYVFYENGKSQAPPTPVPEGDLFKLDMTGGANTWTNLSPNLPDLPGSRVGVDPLALQSGYNMLLKVKPDNPNVVFLGGTNLYRSNDGFATKNNIVLIGGYSTNFNNTYPNSHPDMHNLVFDPTNANRALCANDGGIQLTSDITASSVGWSNLNNYQTLQYYYVAIDPTTGKNDFIGGAQDNGTTFRDSTLVLGARPASRPGLNDHESTFSGDGVSAGISNFHNGSQYLYEGAQQGILFRDNLTNYHTAIAQSIRPAQSLLTAASGGGFGEFVTRFQLSNDNTETLFYVNYNKLFRTISASTVDSTSWDQLSGVETTVNPSGGTSISIRSLAFSRGPYLTSHTMYLGTTNAKIYRLDNYRLTLPANIPVDITPAVGMNGVVQDISVNPNDDNEIMAVVSNYNVTSIWWTNNAKSAVPTWHTAEGNLSLPSIRSCMIVTKLNASNAPVTEYYVGTSIGLYSAINIGVGAGSTVALPVTWVREGGNVLNYAICQSLSYRPADNVLLIGTHGNGMYYSVIGSPNFLPNVITGIFNPVRNDKNFISKAYPTLSPGGLVNYQVGNMFAVKQLHVEVFNIKGQKILQAVKPYQNGTVNISGLSPGAYILNILSNDRKNQFIQKFIKQ